MKILEVRERTVPVGAAIRNASIAFDSMTASAVSLVTDQGTGYAFDSIGRYGKGALLRERFIPRLLAAREEELLDEAGLPDPAAFVRVLMKNEKDGGHGERPGAVGLLESAAWDLRAKREGLPLWKSLAKHFGVAGQGSIRVYGSCGHFRAGELGALADEVRRAVQAGFTTVKIKVGGADLDEDRRRVDAALAAGGGAAIAVDVNGKLAAAIAGRWLASMPVAWVEEPASPLDFEFLKRCRALSPVPLGTGENLFSLDDARNLLRYGGLDARRDCIQVDPLLAYGVGEYERIVRAFEEAGWPRAAFRPHAGHLMNAQVVAGLGLGMAEAAPDASLSYGGYWDGSAVSDGTIVLPDHPGVGYEAKQNLIREFP